MSRQAAHTTVIIGCGNVAWHLAKRLREQDHSVFIYNHQPNPALTDFSKKLKCITQVGLEQVQEDADFYFICVADQFLKDASRHIRAARPEAVIAHTSGSAEISDIKSTGGSKGVLYPLQTFSKQDAINWNEITLVIETEHKAAEKKLSALAKTISQRPPVFLNYKRRLKLHLAAVFANNFANALYAAATEFSPVQTNQRPIDLLLPLIKQTTAKLERLDPIQAQTGPAKRKDKEVQAKHLRLLSKHGDLEKIYRQLSQLIIKQQDHA